jgi:hypothetical protein
MGVVVGEQRATERERVQVEHPKYRARVWYVLYFGR